MTDWPAALSALSTPPTKKRGTTSDLSIDEVLLLHSAGWEPVDLVCGVSWWSIPWGTFQYTLGVNTLQAIPQATEAFAGAFGAATADLLAECARVKGVGVVGVEIDTQITAHHVAVSLTGTAIRESAARPRHSAPPPGAGRAGPRTPGGSGPFCSDLSARDFALLDRAGWVPLGLVSGASFVMAPRRTVGQWFSQQTQNMELPNLTEALYQAREDAMSRMQHAASALEADGVVSVRLAEGPLGIGSHVVRFVAMGTAVAVGPLGHQNLAPTMVVPVDDRALQFQAGSLRAKR